VELTVKDGALQLSTPIARFCEAPLVLLDKARARVSASVLADRC
jgi:hypothetical protein